MAKRKCLEHDNNEHEVPYPKGVRTPIEAIDHNVLVVVTEFLVWGHDGEDFNVWSLHPLLLTCKFTHDVLDAVIHKRLAFAELREWKLCWELCKLGKHAEQVRLISEALARVNPGDNNKEEYIHKVDYDETGRLVYLGFSLREETLVLPEALSTLESTGSINFEGAGIKRLPYTIGQLEAGQTLSFADNGIKELPKSIEKVKVGAVLNLSDNSLDELPNGMVYPSSVRWLYLTKNPLCGFPEGFCDGMIRRCGLHVSKALAVGLPESILHTQANVLVVSNANVKSKVLSALSDGERLFHICE